MFSCYVNVILKENRQKSLLKLSENRKFKFSCVIPFDTGHLFG